MKFGKHSCLWMIHTLVDPLSYHQAPPVPYPHLWEGLALDLYIHVLDDVVPARV